MKKVGLGLIINEGLSQEDTKIVKLYWKMKQGEFVNTPAAVAQKFAMDVYQLRYFIENRSCYFFPFAPCVNCGADLSIKASSQSEYKRAIQVTIRSCRDCTHKKVEQIWKKDKQSDGRYNDMKKQDKKHDQEKEEYSAKHLRAIKNKIWLGINDFQLAILKKIVNNNIKNVKQLETRILSKDQEVLMDEWTAVYQLCGLNLLDVNMIEEGYFEDINYHPSLKEALQQPVVLPKMIYRPESTMGFLLQPDRSDGIHHFYSVFTLSKDIVLKAGEVFICTGIEQPDGSIFARVSASEV
jgi:hypothetical protein